MKLANRLIPIASPRVLPGLALIALCAWLGWLALASSDYRQALDAVARQPLLQPLSEVQHEGVASDSLAIALMFGALPATPGGEHHESAQAVPLTLLASLAAERPEDSRALIGSPEGSRFHRPGERLPGGAVLKAVAADHVLLLRNGREQRLGFERHTERLLVPRPASFDSPETSP
ncbi:type II secretion system protein N [Pseudomonas solani]|uniref:type II secretion system protein N n=1 Tax=Pseudomonas solani TaxID=2731552 RepID=UPI003C2E6C84